jgi:hypothetical protein
MIVFLDFEASSLSDDSYPVEVGWIFEDRRAESFLIRPAAGWTDWDPQAEAIHGLSRDTLEREGVPHEEVASTMVRELGGHQLYASAPSWDGKWLSLLLRAAGHPRRTLRLQDTDQAHLEIARQLLTPCTPAELVDLQAEALLREVRQAADQVPPAHRALPDARREQEIWLEVRRRAGLRSCAPREPGAGRQ